MAKAAIESGTKESQVKAPEESFIWRENSAVQKLLDVVTSIMAEEYIQVAKQNSDVFSNGPLA